MVSNAALDLGRQRGRRETISLDAALPGDREQTQPLVDHDPGLGLDMRSRVAAAGPAGVEGLLAI